MRNALIDTHNTELLFFIIIYLLLFYDGSSIGIDQQNPQDSTMLFFILIFLLLFYK